MPLGSIPQSCWTQGNVILHSGSPLLVLLFLKKVGTTTQSGIYKYTKEPCLIIWHLVLNVCVVETAPYTFNRNIVRKYGYAEKHLGHLKGILYIKAVWHLVCT